MKILPQMIVIKLNTMTDEEFILLTLKLAGKIYVKK